MKVYDIREFGGKSSWEVTEEDRKNATPIAESDNVNLGMLLHIKGHYYDPIMTHLRDEKFCIVKEIEYDPDEEYDTDMTDDPICPYCGHKIPYESIGKNNEGLLHCENCNGIVRYQVDFNPVWYTEEAEAPEVLEL